MNFFEPALLILLLAVLSVPLAMRFHLPLEVFLVIGSCLIALIPHLPPFQLNPQIVFRLFLPPILFYAAYFTSWRDFKFNFRPISLLAFGLVFVTVLVIATIAHLIIPNVSWAEGFLLGAIISPTDASAATSIIRKFSTPRRMITILEGESLINDAAALLLFKFSLGAIITGTFSLPHAIVDFAIITIGGAGVGILVAYVAVFIVRFLRSVQAETTLTLLTAFISYLIAEHLEVSGVIATVVSGLYFGIHFPQLTTSLTRISAKATWNTLIFVVNGFAFTLIGLALPTILTTLQTYSLKNLIGYALIVSLGVFVTRMIFLYFIAYGSRLLFPSITRRDPMPRWEALFLLGWCGMRGIVSLAAALSIPFQLSQGVPFPHRDIFLFITFSVIVISLLLPAISLPYLINRFALVDSENPLKEEAIARIHSLKAAHDKIEELAQREKISSEVINELRNQIKRRLNVISTQLSKEPYSTLNQEYMMLKKLTLAALESERQELIQLRKVGEISDDIFHQLLDELDYEEMRARTLRI